MGVFCFVVFCRISHLQDVVEEGDTEFVDGSTWFTFDGSLRFIFWDGRDGDFRLLFLFGDKPSVGDFGFWRVVRPQINGFAVMVYTTAYRCLPALSLQYFGGLWVF